MALPDWLPSLRTIRARGPALLAALSTLLGVLTSVDVLPLLPPTMWGKPTGAVLIALGAIVASFTRPVYGPAAARAGAQYRKAPTPPPTPEHPERAPIAPEELLTEAARLEAGLPPVPPAAAFPRPGEQPGPTPRG